MTKLLDTRLYVVAPADPDAEVDLQVGIDVYTNEAEAEAERATGSMFEEPMTTPMTQERVVVFMPTDTLERLRRGMTEVAIFAVALIETSTPVDLPADGLPVTLVRTDVIEALRKAVAPWVGAAADIAEAEQAGMGAVICRAWGDRG
jgi:hypothetical protein